ncbi:MAG TPA: hypothetical protein VGC13_00415 [Longimicrobium sp.]|jgi:hypothetical protein|uniref:hypothetical protein n=1 Tax=Longimicrobium sp. TaxID=2029185 RepID=UPI002EDBB36D
MSNVADGASQPGLAPPWITLQRQLAATIGRAPGVRVGQPREQGRTQVIEVTVEDPAAGTGLATILTPQYPGNTIQVKVLSPAGQPYPARLVGSNEELQGVVRAALGANPLFVETVIASTTPPIGPRVWVVFQAQVVQFPNDDISDLFLNFNGVAEDVFAAVLRGDYGPGLVLSTSTQRAARGHG